MWNTTFIVHIDFCFLTSANPDQYLGGNGQHIKPTNGHRRQAPANPHNSLCQINLTENQDNERNLILISKARMMIIIWFLFSQAKLIIYYAIDRDICCQGISLTNLFTLFPLKFLTVWHNYKMMGIGRAFWPCQFLDCVSFRLELSQNDW